MITKALTYSTFHFLAKRFIQREIFWQIYVQNVLVPEINLNMNLMLTELPAEIPFKVLQNDPQSFKSLGRDVFIAECGINIRIIDVERNSASNFLNPNL